jgi:hypothetical protein
LASKGSEPIQTIYWFFPQINNEIFAAIDVSSADPTMDAGDLLLVGVDAEG